MSEQSITATPQLRSNQFEVEFASAPVTGRATATLMIETRNLGSTSTREPQRIFEQIIVEMHLSPVRHNGTDVKGTLIFQITPNENGTYTAEAQVVHLRALLDDKPVPFRVRRAVTNAATEQILSLVTPRTLAAARVRKAETDAAWAQKNLDRASAMVKESEAALGHALAALEALV